MALKAAGVVGNVPPVRALGVGDWYAFHGMPRRAFSTATLDAVGG